MASRRVFAAPRMARMGNPVVHFEVGCRDKDRSAKFFSDCFGWEAGPYHDLAKSLTPGGDSIDGHVTALGHEPHNYVLFYIEVEDIAAALEKVTAEGGAAHIGPLEIPGDGRSFAWFKDPDGNMLGLITPKAD